MDKDEGEEGGMEMEVEETPSNVQENADGSAIITLDEPQTAQSAEFYANLSEEMDKRALADISQQLLEFIDRDKEARKLRDTQYEEGLRRTGLGHIPSQRRDLFFTQCVAKRGHGAHAIAQGRDHP